jgi:hypothetical protein
MSTGEADLLLSQETRGKLRVASGLKETVFDLESNRVLQNGKAFCRLQDIKLVDVREDKAHGELEVPEGQLVISAEVSAWKRLRIGTTLSLRMANTAAAQIAGFVGAVAVPLELSANNRFPGGST